MKRLFFSIVLALMVLSPAAAHGFLVRAVPDDRAVVDRAPARVQYWFSESLEPAFSKLTVRDANGNIIATGGTEADSPTLLSAQLPPNLPDGAYIADLRLAFASDGHVIAETRVFFVGAEVAGVSGGTDAQADMLEVIWRAGTFTGLILAFGTTVLYGRVLLPAWGSTAHRAGGLPPRVMARLTLMAGGGLALAIGAQIFALLHQSVVFFGVGMDVVLSQSLWGVVRTSTRFGEVWNARMLVMIVCAAMLGIGWYNRRSQPELTRPMWSAAGWGLAIGLGASSVISHAAGSRTAAWAALLLDWTHLIAVAIWVGGLVALVFTLQVALKPLGPDEARKALLATLRRFSPIAAACLFIVVGTGIFSASLWVRPSDLVTTEYGLALLVKLGMVACLVALGAVHFRALRVDRAAQSKQERASAASAVRRPLADRWPMAPGRFLSTLRLEAIFGILVLVGAGWLTAAPVPVPPDAITTVETLTAGAAVPAPDGQPYDITMTVSPGGPGVNTIDLVVTQAGEPVDGISADLQAAQPARDLRGIWNELQPLDGGAYSTVTPEIDQPGEWLTLVDLHLPDGETTRAAFRWAIRTEAAIEPALPLNPVQAAALILALTSLGYAASPFARRVYRRLDLSPQAVSIAAVTTVGSIFAMFVGLVMIDQQHAAYEATVNPPPQVVNTVLPDANSLSRGEQLIAETCGWSAESTGWRELTTRLPRTRDEELFAFSRDGYRGLPACPALTDEQRWDVVNALRAALQT